MTNPFDRSFFKFFLGFVLILTIGFGILYFVGRYTSSLDRQATVLEQK